MQLYEELSSGLNEAVRLSVTLQAVRRTRIENREGIQLVAEKRIYLELLLEFIVLSDEANEELCVELVNAD